MPPASARFFTDGRRQGEADVRKDATPFNVTGLHSGGARVPSSAPAATAFPSDVRNVPVGIAETIAPVLIWAKDIEPIRATSASFVVGLAR